MTSPGNDAPRAHVKTKAASLPIMRPQCGTESGWQKHHQNGEPPCDACLGRRRNKMRSYRRRTSTKCLRGLGWPERSP